MMSRLSLAKAYILREILQSLNPEETVLMANYPNPFNPETWIPYHLG